MRLSVTTPRGALVDTDVEEVTAPGTLGEFGVLPGHVPLMSALKPGVLVYRAKEGAPAGVIVVAASVDRAQATKDLADAEKELAAWKAELDGAYRALVTRRQWAQARLDAADRATPH